jgi:L-ascorbate metabolism protein UlaG (beta-lactamase superfamily)
MRLTYIYNSCFVVEFDDLTLIFDYYRDSSGNDKDGVLHDRILKNKGKIYVFCSHSHRDHFNKEIFSWKEQHSDIIYIFSKEILEAGKAKEDDAVYLDKLGVYEDSVLTVKAYGSTDVGGSFYIEVKGKTIFHAGDLNNWHWKEESTPEEIAEAEAFFQRELDLVSGDLKHIDVAMFPIDPRLGEDYMLGARQFVEAVQIDYLSPMHFGKHYDKIALFEPFAAEHGCKCICWKERGESISIE